LFIVYCLLLLLFLIFFFILLFLKGLAPKATQMKLTSGIGGIGFSVRINNY